MSLNNWDRAGTAWSAFLFFKKKIGVCTSEHDQTWKFCPRSFPLQPPLHSRLRVESFWGRERERESVCVRKKVVFFTALHSFLLRDLIWFFRLHYNKNLNVTDISYWASCGGFSAQKWSQGQKFETHAVLNICNDFFSPNIIVSPTLISLRYNYPNATHPLQ